MIFTVENLLNIFMEHDLNILMIFGIFLFYNFDRYNVFLSISTRKPQQRKTHTYADGMR